jgi:hypothetical protein
LRILGIQGIQEVEEEKGKNGNYGQDCSRVEEVKVQDSAPQPVFPVRAAARVSAQVQFVPDLFPEARVGR